MLDVSCVLINLPLLQCDVLQDQSPLPNLLLPSSLGYAFHLLGHQQDSYEDFLGYCEQALMAHCVRRSRNWGKECFVTNKFEDFRIP